jgi:uncharacterized repeat protein (TIGR01451 family)
LALVAVFLIKGLTFFCICRNFYIFGRNISAMNLAKYCYQIAPKGLGIFCFIFLLCFSSSSFSQQMHAFLDDQEVVDIAFENSKVWIATASSVVCLDTISGQKTFYNYSNSNLGIWINAIEIDDFGNKLIIDEKGLHILNQSNSWTDIDSLNGVHFGHYFNLKKDKQGKIWIYSQAYSTINNQTKYCIWENQSLTFHNNWSTNMPLIFDNISFDSYGNFYYVANTAEIYKVDSLLNITVLNRYVLGLCDLDLSHVVAQNDGTLWVTYQSTSQFSKISSSGVVSNFLSTDFGMFFTSASFINMTIDRLDQVHFYTKTTSGIYKFDGVTSTHISLAPFSAQYITLIDFSESNSIYIGTFGLELNEICFYKQSNGTTTPIDISNSGIKANDINAMAIDYDGNKWIATRGQGVQKFDGNTWSQYLILNGSFDNNNIYDIIVTHDNVIWFTVFDGVIGKIENDVLSIVNTAGLPNYLYYSIVEDKFNNIWVHGTYGLYKYNGISWSYFQNPNNASIGGSGYSSNTLTADTLGNIWGATGALGIFKFDGISQYTFYNNINNAINPNTTDPVYSVYCDKQNNIYYTPHFYNSMKFDGNTATSYTLNGFSFTNILSESDSTFLFLTYDGVYRNQGNNSTKILDGDKIQFVRSIAKDLNNNIWLPMSFDGGLLCFNESGLGENPFVNQPQNNIAGKVYFDQNQNGIAEVGDAGLPWKGVKNNTNNTVVYTNTNGNFVQYLANGDYVIQENFQAQSNFILTSDSVSYHVSLNQSNATNLNFGAFTDAIEDSIIVNFSPGLVRCNTTVNNWITITNYSVFPFTGDVNLQFDDSLGFSFNNIQGTLNGNTATWHIDSLMPFQSMTISFITQNPTVGFINNITNGTIDYSLSVTNPNILYSSNHSYNLLCSYDPNFKEVNPPGVGFQNHTLQNTPLEYTLHFQNMGNDTAFHVLVTDTLSSMLNPETFEYIAASHTVNITRIGNILKFDFPHINLLPKSMNEPLSQGFVKFRIKTFENLPDYSILNNTANIYFDFNPAVITNTSLNTLVYELDANVEELSNLNNQVLVYPNPANKILTIDLQNINIENCIITNALGRTVYNSANEINANHKIQLNISHLNTGVYFVKVRSGNGSYTAKFVKAE